MTVAEELEKILVRGRGQFSTRTDWGPLRDLRRFEVCAPMPEAGTLAGLHEGRTVHTRRASFALSVGGGNLSGPRAAIADAVSERLCLRLRGAEERRLRPAEVIADVVGWLEGERAPGQLLEDAYVTGLLAVAVSGGEVWAWIVGAMGCAGFSGGRVRLLSSDLRRPALASLGVRPAALWTPPSVTLSNRVSSIFAVGAPQGYQEVRSSLSSGEAVLCLDRAYFPIQPWPQEGVSLAEFWALDAGWTHGLSGVAVAFGNVEAADLAVPSGWKVRHAPLE